MIIAPMPPVKLSELGADVPAGTYSVRVHTANYVSEPKNKDANPYIQTRLSITGPDDAEEFKGRLLFPNYPLAGNGSYRLRQLLTVTGHDVDFELKDPAQLLNLEFLVEVEVEKGKDGYPDKRVVKRHLPLAT